eukprot:1754545-Rhodomonas_salina.1
MAYTHLGSYLQLAVQSWARLAVVTCSGRHQPARGEVSSWLDPGLNYFRPPLRSVSRSLTPGPQLSLQARSGLKPKATAAARVAPTHTDVLSLRCEPCSQAAPVSVASCLAVRQPGCQLAPPASSSSWFTCPL